MKQLVETPKSPRKSALKAAPPPPEPDEEDTYDGPIEDLDEPVIKPPVEQLAESAAAGSKTILVMIAIVSLVGLFLFLPMLGGRGGGLAILGTAMCAGLLVFSGMHLRGERK